MTVHELHNKLTNSIPDSRDNYIFNRYLRQLGLVNFMCNVLYGIALLIFISLAFVSDASINIKSTIIGNHSIMFTMNRAMLFAIFIAIMLIIAVFEYLYIEYLKGEYTDQKLTLTYGTITGLNKIKK